MSYDYITPVPSKDLYLFKDHIDFDDIVEDEVTSFLCWKSSGALLSKAQVREYYK